MSNLCFWCVFGFASLFAQILLLNTKYSFITYEASLNLRLRLAIFFRAGEGGGGGVATQASRIPSTENVHFCDCLSSLLVWPIWFVPLFALVEFRGIICQHTMKRGRQACLRLPCIVDITYVAG